MEQRKHWRRLNGTIVTQSIWEEVRAVLMEETENGHAMKVCIGTDSQVKGRITEFATVIVFIRRGKGGYMYIQKEESLRRMSIKERMLEEVGRTIVIAHHLSDLFTAFNVDMEVHADINTNPAFKSNDALKEAMGYMMGMGYAFRVKPYAFASSSCANKVVQ